jgi:hypothetical protein
LNKLFVSPEEITDRFQQMVTEYIHTEMEKRKKTDANFDTEAQIERQLKTMIARNLYDSNKSAKIWLTLDETYKRAVEIINDTHLFKKLNITY